MEDRGSGYLGPASSPAPAPARVKRPVCGNVGPNVGAQSQSGVDRATTTTATTTSTSTTTTDEGPSRAGAGPAAVADEGG